MRKFFLMNVQERVKLGFLNERMKLTVFFRKRTNTVKVVFWKIFDTTNYISFDGN